MDALFDKVEMTSFTRTGEHSTRLHYNTVDEAAIKAHFIKKKATIQGGCTAVWNNGIIGRNYDWFYNNDLNHEIHVDNDGKGYRYSGVASMTELDWGILPGFTQDGFNEHGLYCNINVVPDDYGTTTGTTPLVEEREKVCLIMVPFYVLRHFTTPDEAVDYIRNYVSLYAPKGLSDMHYEAHFMIANAEKCYILEVVHNEIQVTEHPIITNFFIYGTRFNEDGTVYTMEDGQSPVELNGITPFGSGLERYNYVVENYAASGSKAGMMALMEGLKYTNAYRPEVTPRWYSEFVGHYQQDVTLDTPIDDPYYQHVLGVAEAAYEAHDRDASNFWQSSHTSVYDLDREMMWIVFEEDFTRQMPACLEEYYTAGEIKELLDN